MELFFWLVSGIVLISGIILGNLAVILFSLVIALAASEMG